MSSNADDGIETTAGSNNNFIIGNVVQTSGDEGMSILSNGNRIGGNFASNNTSDGIEVLFR